MTANMPLPDTIIDAALARCAERISGDGLHDEIMAGVSRTSQVRRPILARLDWLAKPSPSLRLAWVLAIAVLLLALLGASLFVGSRFVESPPRQLVDSLPRHPAALVPTGVETPGPGSSTFGRAVADPSGAVWAYAAGALGRLDPSGAVRTWTHADDAAFGSIDGIVPARGGGVWLVPPVESADRALRWFDGERFRDVVPAPPGGPPDFAETPDESLWSGSASGLFHWDGTSWSAAPDGRPATGVSRLVVDRSGAVWVVNCDSAGECSSLGISRFDGTRWETFANLAAPRSITEAPDGSIWVADGEGFARYDGHAWTRMGGDWPLRPVGDVKGRRVTWAADGTAWLTQCAYVPYGALAAHQDGSSWVEYGMEDGLPVGANCGQLVAVAHGVYFGTDDGLYRLVDDRWERVWP